jgi:hypothetical protein
MQEHDRVALATLQIDQSMPSDGHLFSGEPVGVTGVVYPDRHQQTADCVR